MITVLVVDDRATNREVAREILSDGGYRVIEATDGRQALHLARSRHPDLVLTDMLMPGIDGYQLAQQMREDPGTAAIPLIFYTANYRRDEVRPLAEAVGISRVVEKTATPRELLDAIAEALRESPRDEAGHPAGPATTRHVDMLNAKLLEKADALDESEARFSAMAEASPVGIIITDARSRATYVNPGVREMTGWRQDQLLERGWLRCLGMDLSGGEGTGRRDCRLVHPDGSHRRLTVLLRPILDSEGTVTGQVVTVDDVTAVVEAEERRRQDDRERAAEARRQAIARFDSLARLAGGVAHDFNNLLNIILSFGDFIDDALDDVENTVLVPERSGEIRHDVDRIRQAGRRAAELTQQLLTFGGKELITPVLVDLTTVVREVVDLIHLPDGSSITVTTDLAADVSPVKGDPAKLRQALLDLTANAVEAMGSSGHLHIAVGNGTGMLADRTGPLVHLCVADTGCGMTPEILDQAMEPFFTTKARGSGPGLGLATSYGIVRQAGGRLQLESEPGRGTTAHIYLPPARPAPAPPPPATGGHGRDRATILVAEDEAGLREVILRILRKAGYHVLAAADGAEAAVIAREHDGLLDAVLSDVVMPVMNGRELAAALTVSRPGTPVLFMSGYAEPLMNEQGLIETDATVLRKPFTRDELLTAIRRTLAVSA